MRFYYFGLSLAISFALLTTPPLWAPPKDKIPQELVESKERDTTKSTPVRAKPIVYDYELLLGSGEDSKAPTQGKQAIPTLSLTDLREMAKEIAEDLGDLAKSFALTVTGAISNHTPSQLDLISFSHRLTDPIITRYKALVLSVPIQQATFYPIDTLPDAVPEPGEDWEVIE